MISLLILKQQKGFLMVESLLAIVVISIVLTAATVMFMQSTKANAGGVEITTAAALGQKQMEMLKAKPANYWDGLTGLPQSIVWQDLNETMPLTKNNIVYNVTTVAADTVQDPNLVQVTVQVSWNGKVISVVSFFSKIVL